MVCSNPAGFMKFLFFHGWQSVPGGVKPTYLAQHGHEVVNPQLPERIWPRPSGSPIPSTTGNGQV